MPPFNSSKHQEALIRMTNYSDDLLRLFKCYVDTATAFLSDFADDKILHTTGKSFQSFLEGERHFFYHQLEQKRTSCCACPPHGCSIGRIKKMNKMMFDTLYESTGTVESGHEIVHGGCLQQRCIHRYVPRNITLDDLDTTIICYLLYTKAALHPTEEGHIATISKYRNDICHIWSKPNSYTNISTSQIWMELEGAILGLISKPARQKMMKTFLQTHRQYQIEKEDSKVIAEVLEKVKQMHEYLEVNNQWVANNSHEQVDKMQEVLEVITESQQRETQNVTTQLSEVIKAEMLKIATKCTKGTGNKIYQSVGNLKVTIEYPDSSVFVPVNGVLGNIRGIWYIECPHHWNITEVEALIDSADLEKHPFKIKFVKKGSIWLVTTVPETCLTNSTTFEFQIQSFISTLIEVCQFDTSTPCNVEVFLSILQDSVQLEVGGQSKAVDRSTQTDSDSIVPEKLYNVQGCMDQTTQTDDKKTDLRVHDNEKTVHNVQVSVDITPQTDDDQSKKENIDTMTNYAQAQRSVLPVKKGTNKTNDFVKLILFSYDTTSSVTKTFIECNVLPKYNNSLTDFLERHKHEIFHMWRNDTKCCHGNCRLLRPRLLRRDQFMNMYFIRSKVTPGHYKRSLQCCSCGLTVNTSCTLDTLDILVIKTLVLNLCTVEKDEEMWLETIHKIRNKLSHVESVSEFDEGRLQKWWDMLECSVMGLVSKTNAIPAYKELVQRQIDDLKSAKFNVDQVKETAGNVKLRDSVIRENLMTSDMVSGDLTEQTILLKDQIDLVKADVIRGLGSSVSDKKVRVEWTLESSDSWKVEQISKALNAATQMLKNWFDVEYVYVG